MVRVVVCCARTATGADKGPAAAALIAVMKSRRLMLSPKAQERLSYRSRSAP